MGPIWDMCHHMIGWKSNVMDKRKSKRANGVLTCGNEDIPLDPPWTKFCGGRANWREGRKEGEKREKKKVKRETLHSF